MLAVPLAAGLAGCAMTGRAPELAAFDGARYEMDSHNQEFISGVTFQYPGHAPRRADALPLCAAKTIDNRSVSLSDSSRSFVGPYSGYYYDVKASREAGGGAVLRYVSDDKKEVVADGSARYSFTFGFAPVERAVRFAAAIKLSPAATVVSFDKLEEAQLDTGILSNDGFRRIGAWSGTHSDLALAALQKVADAVVECVGQQ